MDIAGFENNLKADGFQEIETKRLLQTCNPEHSHPFDVRALVLDGAIALGVAGESRTYAKGDVFSMPANCRHTEEVGTEGVQYLFGRRHLAKV